MTTDTDALVATVRKSLRDIVINPDSGKWEYVKRDGSDHVNAEAALDTLAAELAESDQRIRELEADPDRPNVIYAGDELEAAEAELERVKAERDAYNVLLVRRIDKCELTEARLDKALAALREIATDRDFQDGDLTIVAHIARAAIAEIEGEA